MSTTVCLVASTITYPQGGGHMWAYLNWALGLRSLGCRVIWLERLSSRLKPQRADVLIRSLKERLKPYRLDDALAVATFPDALPAGGALDECLTLDDAADSADVLVNLQYDFPAAMVRRFRRSVLLDIDPGLLQVWMACGQIRVAPHDVFFTTGETVGQPGGAIPSCGIDWRYIPPAVALEYWPATLAAADAPFTTISHWYADEWVQSGGEVYPNDKRSGFLPFLDLPELTNQPLELALCLGDDEHERQRLLDHGWRLRESESVSATPWDYQRYIQSSRGEFSCAKPSCIRLQNAWISDRTLCYLASGKPAIVQNTGPSRWLTENAGLLRFNELNEAVGHLRAVAADYERHARAARALAERCFDARRVSRALLERVLT